MSVGEEIVCADIAELARRAAEEWTRIERESIAARGRFTVALSGGETPRHLYRALAGDEFRGRISWDRAQFFWGDERAVPADHPDSNYRSAYEALFSKVPAPAENIHRIEAERGAENAAAAYEAKLRAIFALAGSARPRFDLILLGMGEDGHTASLFPGSAALREEKRLVVATFVEKLNSHRITLTLPVLNRAANVIFLIAGAAKAEAVKRVLRSEASDLPAAQVRPESGRLFWILDHAAAELL